MSTEKLDKLSAHKISARKLHFYHSYANFKVVRRLFSTAVFIKINQNYETEANASFMRQLSHCAKNTFLDRYNASRNILVKVPQPRLNRAVPMALIKND